MALDSELDILRRAYAKRIMFAAGVVDGRVQDAFAVVPRETFLDPGPWQVVRWSFMSNSRGYVTTPSADPVYIYDDTIVALLPQRNLNNGQPSLHARSLAALAVDEGETVVQIGAGAGYYTAILAHLVGPSGKIVAYEAGMFRGPKP